MSNSNNKQTGYSCSNSGQNTSNNNISNYVVNNKKNSIFSNCSNTGFNSLLYIHPEFNNETDNEDDIFDINENKSSNNLSYLDNYDNSENENLDIDKGSFKDTEFNNLYKNNEVYDKKYNLEGISEINNKFKITCSLKEKDSLNNNKNRDNNKEILGNKKDRSFTTQKYHKNKSLLSNNLTLSFNKDNSLFKRKLSVFNFTKRVEIKSSNKNRNSSNNSTISKSIYLNTLKGNDNSNTNVIKKKNYYALGNILEEFEGKESYLNSKHESIFEVNETKYQSNSIIPSINNNSDNNITNKTSQTSCNFSNTLLNNNTFNTLTQKIDSSSFNSYNLINNNNNNNNNTIRHYKNSLIDNSTIKLSNKISANSVVDDNLNRNYCILDSNNKSEQIQSLANNNNCNKFINPKKDLLNLNYNIIPYSNINLLSDNIINNNCIENISNNKKYFEISSNNNLLVSSPAKKYSIVAPKIKHSDETNIDSSNSYLYNSNIINNSSLGLYNYPTSTNNIGSKNMLNKNNKFYSALNYNINFKEPRYNILNKVTSSISQDNNNYSIKHTNFFYGNNNNSNSQLLNINNNKFEHTTLNYNNTNNKYTYIKSNRPFTMNNMIFMNLINKNQNEKQQQKKNIKKLSEKLIKHNLQDSNKNVSEIKNIKEKVFCENSNHFKCNSSIYNTNHNIINTENNNNNSNTQNKKDKKKKQLQREGDWICLECQNMNFSFRTKCNKCSFEKINIKISENIHNKTYNDIKDRHKDIIEIRENNIKNTCNTKSNSFDNKDNYNNNNCN